WPAVRAPRGPGGRRRVAGGGQSGNRGIVGAVRRRCSRTDRAARRSRAFLPATHAVGAVSRSGRDPAESGSPIGARLVRGRGNPVARPFAHRLVRGVLV